MLTRKMLSAMGLEPEKIAQIIEGHTESITGLQDDLDKAKAEVEKYKAEADKVAGLQKELETAKKEAETAKNSGAKYETLKNEFEAYKAEQEKKASDAVKTEKFRELLTDIGLTEKGVAMVLKYQGVDVVEIGEDGKIANAKDLRKSIKEDWGDYITTTSEHGEDDKTPPANTGGGKMTIDQIDAIQDTTERQKAMLENKELYGL